MQLIRQDRLSLVGLGFKILAMVLTVYLLNNFPNLFYERNPITRAVLDNMLLFSMIQTVAVSLCLAVYLIVRKRYVRNSKDIGAYVAINIMVLIFLAVNAFDALNNMFVMLVVL